jgi:hypothetical protein
MCINVSPEPGPGTYYLLPLPVLKVTSWIAGSVAATYMEMELGDEYGTYLLFAIAKLPDPPNEGNFTIPSRSPAATHAVETYNGDHIFEDPAFHISPILSLYEYLSVTVCFYHH